MNNKRSVEEKKMPSDKDTKRTENGDVWKAWSEIEFKDCMEGMKKICDNSMDLIITDPPYGIKKASWDKLNLDWIDEAYRILKDSGSFYVFGSVWWYPIVHMKAISVGFVPKNILCWHYGNSTSRLNDNYQMCWEPIGFFIKGSKSQFNLDDIRVPYKSTERIRYKIIKNGKVWTPNPNGRKIGNVIKVPALAGKSFSKERTSHPTQKPINLIKVLIKASSKERDIVFDPFIGSGTTAVAANILNRHCVGFENNKKYFDIAHMRIEELEL